MTTGRRAGWTALAALAALALGLALGGCATTETQQQWKRDADREALIVARVGIVCGVLASAVLAVRRGRREAIPEAEPAEPVVVDAGPESTVRVVVGVVARAAGAGAMAIAGVGVGMGVGLVVYPRDTFNQRPLTSPDGTGILLYLMFVAPLAVLALLLGGVLTSSGARRLHPRGNVALQEAIVGIGVAAGLLMLTRST